MIERLIRLIKGDTGQDGPVDEENRNRQFMIEAVVGLIVLVTLIIFAVWLLLRGSTPFGNRSDDKGLQAEVTEEANEAAPDEEVTTDITDISDTADTSDTVGAEQVGSGIDLTEKAREEKLKGTKELPQVYTPGNRLEYTEDKNQMPELYGYWDAYELEAVSDIIHLERMRKITDSLAGKNDYYYYGALDSSGKPDGKGLAIYSDNTYYFGEWKEGLRNGTGMWVRIFPDEPGVVNGVTGVVWHQYSGEWSNDYPNGKGQEHFTYEGSNADKEEYAIQNVIGGFNNGFYDGEEYIMTVYNGSSTDWYGTAERGIFKYIGAKTNTLGKRAIWKAAEGYDTGEEDNCRWIIPSQNADFGIAGLKKGR